MRFNSYLLTLIIAICTSISTFYGAHSRGSVIIEGDHVEREAVWIGPGWYYGIWFGDEYEYRDWYHRHHSRDRRGGHHRDREHDRHHDMYHDSHHDKDQRHH